MQLILCHLSPERLAQRAELLRRLSSLTPALHSLVLRIGQGLSSYTYKVESKFPSEVVERIRNKGVKYFCIVSCAEQPFNN